MPSSDDWKILVDFLGGMNKAGRKIKETGDAHWSPSNTNSTNESGFTALPGGIRNVRDFNQINHYGYFWSSSKKSNWSKGSKGWYISSINDYFRESETYYLHEGLSVRCILGKPDISIPVVQTLNVTDLSSQHSYSAWFHN